MADPTPNQRKLAAILAADVAGYSRLMGGGFEVGRRAGVTSVWAKSSPLNNRGSPVSRAGA